MCMHVNHVSGSPVSREAAGYSPPAWLRLSSLDCIQCRVGTLSFQGNCQTLMSRTVGLACARNTKSSGSRPCPRGRLCTPSLAFCPPWHANSRRDHAHRYRTKACAMCQMSLSLLAASQAVGSPCRNTPPLTTRPDRGPLSYSSEETPQHKPSRQVLNRLDLRTKLHCIIKLADSSSLPLSNHTGDALLFSARCGASV